MPVQRDGAAFPLLPRPILLDGRHHVGERGISAVGGRDVGADGQGPYGAGTGGRSVSD